MKISFVLPLLFLFLFAGCHDKTKIRQLTYPVKKIEKTNRVNVQFLAYKTSTKEGVMIPARISVSPNPGNELNVGVTGNLSGGVGASWRSAVWIASLQAAFAVGRDLADYQIIVNGQGYIDGPSAGALFTAGIMAGMMGLAVREDVSMTGTVNPDGTIGPVGGIPNKFRAALAQGKRILGYPPGQRYSKDLKTGKRIDLKKLATDNGARVYEMRSIYDAFGLITGKVYPRPQAASPEEMKIEPEVSSIIRKKAAKWNQIYNNYRRRYQKNNLQKLKSTHKKMQIASNYMNEAVKYVKMDRDAVAYDFAQRGAGHAFTTFWNGIFNKLVYRKEKWSTINNYLNKRLIEPTFLGLQKGLEVLKDERPQTLEEFSALISSYEQIVSAYVYAMDSSMYSKDAKNLLRKAPELIRKKVPVNTLLRTLYDYLAKASLRTGIATLKYEKGIDFLSFTKQGSPYLDLLPARINKVRNLYLGAAQANYKYIESIIVKKVADQMGKTLKYARNRIMSRSNNYLQAFYSLKIPELIFSKKWGKNNTGTIFAQIAGSLGSYLNSSMFLVKIYNLSGILDKRTGYIKSIKNEKVLEDMLIYAEKNARINAAVAKKELGDIPTMAKVFYQIGLAMMEMPLSLKVKSLEMFWRSSMECQLSELINRK